MTYRGKELNDLYRELEVVKSMSNESVCSDFNADSKDEYIEILNSEIRSIEIEIENNNEYRNRTRNFEKTADTPFICW